MTSDGQQDESSSQDPIKAPWIRPALKPLGKMKDLILGAGKTGSALDQDPTGTFKRGTG
jgi:hypothetical protein